MGIVIKQNGVNSVGIVVILRQLHAIRIASLGAVLLTRLGGGIVAAGVVNDVGVIVAARLFA